MSHVSQWNLGDLTNNEVRKLSEGVYVFPVQSGALTGKFGHLPIDRDGTGSLRYWAIDSGSLNCAKAIIEVQQW